MIEPHLATMFCFLATDAVVSRVALDAVLRRAVNRSLNRIAVDGDQSTSDTVAILANGLAETAPLERPGPALRQFAHGVEAVAERLARMLIAAGVRSARGRATCRKSMFGSTGSTRRSRGEHHHAHLLGSVPPGPTPGGRRSNGSAEDWIAAAARRAAPSAGRAPRGSTGAGSARPSEKVEETT